MVSAAVALVATGDEIEIEEAVGEAPAGLATRFDYASVTKPFVATLALVLDAEGVLPLATRIGDVWPGRTRGWPRDSSPISCATARGWRRGRRSTIAAGPWTRRSS